MRTRTLSESAKQVVGLEQVQKFLPDSLKYICSSQRQTFNPPTNNSNSVTFHFGSETFQTSYTIFGDLKSGTRPSVVLNGGPCNIAHVHAPVCQPIQDTRSTNHPVRPARLRRDKPAGFLTPALFTTELHNLSWHLRISRTVRT